MRCPNGGRHLVSLSVPGVGAKAKTITVTESAMCYHWYVNVDTSWRSVSLPTSLSRSVLAARQC